MSAVEIGMDRPEKKMVKKGAGLSATDRDSSRKRLGATHAAAATAVWPDDPHLPF